MGPEVTVRIGLVELGIVLALGLGILWMFRSWLVESTQSAYQLHATQLARAAAEAMEELRREADRLVREASDQMTGTRRGAVAKVHQAIRQAEIVVGYAFRPREPMRYARFTRQDLERLMIGEGFPTRVREEVLDLWLRDHENGLAALDRYLGQVELDRAAQALEEARGTALLNEFYLSQDTATKLRSHLSALARRVSELRNPATGEERRGHLLQEFSNGVEDASELLRAELDMAA